ncbi:MAG: hypothetical protein P1V97_13360 [Planctomycetota bacterium]|nr:hypothetical protein [Planctomycetota bacterium]
MQKTLIFLIILFMAPMAFAQDDLVLKKPPTVSKDLWQKIRQGYKREKELFIKTLLELEENKPDPLRDTLIDTIRKKDQVQKTLSRHSVEISSTIISNRFLALDSVAIRSVTEPHATGRVWKIGKNGDAETISKLSPKLKSGDSVFLLPGTHSAGDFFRGQRGKLTESLTIVGAGPEKTTLRVGRAYYTTDIVRLRLKGMTVDCENRSGLTIRRGSLSLINCNFVNYNSGGGGCISGAGAVVYVEDCVFNGFEGRAQIRGYGGYPFDLRGDNILYVRNTQFIDNREVIRGSFPASFDNCEIRFDKTKAKRNSSSIPGAYYRNLKAKKSRNSKDMAFKVATDDLEFVNDALGKTKVLDKDSLELAKYLNLKRNLRYWIGLLLHRNEKVRQAAAKKIEALCGQNVQLNEKTAIAGQNKELLGFIKELDSDDYNTRAKASKDIEALGEAARGDLKALLKTGSREQVFRAKLLLDTLNRSSLSINNKEFSRLTLWLEVNLGKLKWDAEKHRYYIHEAEKKQSEKK